MADVRVTRGNRIQTIGAPVGVQTNTFGLQRLMAGVSGDHLEEILTDALQIPEQVVQETWPVDTGASVETVRIETDEVGPTHARVSLRIGGAPLIADPRNKKHIDYAPYIEFNGSPGGTPPGTLLYAMTSTSTEVKDYIHNRVRELIEDLSRG